MLIWMMSYPPRHHRHHYCIDLSSIIDISIAVTNSTTTATIIVLSIVVIVSSHANNDHWHKGSINPSTACT
jgi:hypothetical protein